MKMGADYIGAYKAGLGTGQHTNKQRKKTENEPKIEVSYPFYSYDYVLQLHKQRNT
jgi:hypothetical protein